MRTVRVFVQERKVSEIPGEVAAAFSALLGGLSEVEEGFRRCMDWPRGLFGEKKQEALGRVDALEQSALSVIVASVQAAAESMRERLERLENQAVYEKNSPPLVLTYYPKDCPLHGCLWFRHGDDASLEMDIDLRGQDHSGIGVRQLYGRAASFDEAYDRVMAEREAIEALIDAMIATALDRSEVPAEG